MAIYESLLALPVPTAEMSEADRKEFYRWYIASEFWVVRRRRHLDLYPSCQLEKMLGSYAFGHDGITQVHHKNYDNVGNELEDDLVTLCRHCHARYHDKIDVPTWAVICHGSEPIVSESRPNLAIELLKCEQTIIPVIENRKSPRHTQPMDF